MTDGWELERLRGRRDDRWLPSPLAAPAGTPSFVGRVLTKPVADQFFQAAPVAVTGVETQNNAGTFGAPGAAQAVLWLGGSANVGDCVVCRFVNHRWVASLSARSGGPGAGMCSNPVTAIFCYNRCFYGTLGPQPDSFPPLQVSVVGPGGFSASLTMPYTGAGTSPSNPCGPNAQYGASLKIQAIGTYYTTVTSSRTLRHLGSFELKGSCAGTGEFTSLTARYAEVTFPGCWNVQQQGDFRETGLVPNASFTVRYNDGSSAASGTTDSAGYGYLDFEGMEVQKASLGLTLSVEAQYYQPQTLQRSVSGFGSYCSDLVFMRTLPCEQCYQTISYQSAGYKIPSLQDPDRGCQAPQPQGGRFIAPFGEVCIPYSAVTSEPLYVGDITTDVLEATFDSNGKDITCSQPTKKKSVPVLVVRQSENIFQLIIEMTYRCPSYAPAGNKEAVYPSNGNYWFPLGWGVPMFHTPGTCNPAVLQGALSNALDALNGSYSFIQDGCGGCPGATGSYGTSATTNTTAAPPSEAATPAAESQGAARPAAVDRELVVARYNEDATWAQGAS